MNLLDVTVEEIQQRLSSKNSARDRALERSRELIRLCSKSIRATHREEWELAATLMNEAKEKALRLSADLAAFPDLLFAGYTQDALKEYVEAHLTFALIRDQPLPTPDDLEVQPATYLGGLTEAATELRRRILDIIRHEHSAEAERLLDAMDVIYTELTSIDFPDAITHGLRRRTDVLRGVLQRTRGDLTNSLRQQKLQNALRDLESRLSD